MLFLGLGWGYGWRGGCCCLYEVGFDPLYISSTWLTGREDGQCLSFILFLSFFLSFFLFLFVFLSSCCSRCCFCGVCCWSSSSRLLPPHPLILSRFRNLLRYTSYQSWRCLRETNRWGRTGTFVLNHKRVRAKLNVDTERRNKILGTAAESGDLDAKLRMLLLSSLLLVLSFFCCCCSSFFFLFFSSFSLSLPPLSSVCFSPIFVLPEMKVLESSQQKRQN